MTLDVTHQPAGRSPPDSYRRRHLVQWCLLIGLAISLFLAVSLYLARQRDAALQKESEHLGQLATLIGSNLETLLHSTDSALKLIAKGAAARDGAAAMLTSELQIADALNPFLRTVSIVNRDGRIAESSAPEVVGLDVRHRGYFADALAANDPSALHISEPFNSARGFWTIAVARSVQLTDGRFGGLVLGLLDVRDLWRAAAMARPSADAAIFVLHRRGSLFLAVVDNQPQPEGGPIEPPPWLAQAWRDRRVRSEQPSIVSLHVPGKMIRSRSVDLADVAMPAPLEVVVVRDRRALLAAWTRVGRDWLLAFLAVLAGASAALWHAQRQARREHGRLAAERDRAERAMAVATESEARFRSIFDRAGVGIMLGSVDDPSGDGRIVSQPVV